MSSEARVGAIFLIIVGLATATVFFMGQVPDRFGHRMYEMKAYFSDVHGLERGAPVMFAGVSVGKVREVNLPPEYPYIGKPVEVVLELKRDVRISTTDVLSIDQGELLGGRFISIRRGEERPGRRLIDVDGTGVTDNTANAGYAGIPEDVRGLLKDTRSAIASVSATLGSEANRKQMQQILGNINRATYTATLIAQQGLSFATRLASMAGKNDKRIGDMVENLRLASASVLRTADSVRQMVAMNGLPNDMARAGQEIRKSAEDVHAMTQQTRDFITDPELRKRFDSMMANMQQSTANVQVLTERASKLLGDAQMQGDMHQSLVNIREATANVRQTTIDIQKLVSDPETTGDLKASVRNARIATEEGVQVARKAGQTLDRVDRTMDQLGGIASGIKPKRIDTWLNTELALDRGFTGDLNLNLHYSDDPNDYWRVGMSDIGGSEHLILQKAMPMGNDRLRAGVLYGKLALGYDKLWKSGSWEFDLYNPDHLTLDTRAVIPLRHDTDLLIGVDQVLNRNHPFIGARRWFGEAKPETK